MFADFDLFDFSNFIYKKTCAFIEEDILQKKLLYSSRRTRWCKYR